MTHYVQNYAGIIGGCLCEATVNEEMMQLQVLCYTPATVTRY